MGFFDSLRPEEKEKIEASKLKESEIETKIKELKKKLKKASSKYWLKAYDVLSQIYDLRNEQQDDYTIRDLYQKDVKKHFKNEHQVRRIMVLQHASKKTWKRLNEGKVTFNKVASLFRTNIDIAKDNKQQDKIIKEVIKKDLTGNEIKNKARRIKNMTKKSSNRTDDYKKCKKKFKKLRNAMNNYDLNEEEDEKMKKKLAKFKKNYLDEDYIKATDEVKATIKEISKKNNYAKHEILLRALRHYKKKIKKIKEIKEKKAKAVA